VLGSVISITILLTAAGTAVMAVVAALKWRGRARRAEMVADAIKAEADAAGEELEGAKIHARIDRTRREQVEAVLDVLGDAVIVADAHGDLLHANHRAASLLVAPLDESYGQNIAEIMRNSDLGEHIASAARQELADGCPAEFETDFDEVHTTCEVSLQTVGTEKESLRAVVAVLRDLAREREVARLKSDFVSKASHELRTPLSSIAAYVEMLIDGDAADEAARGEFYTVIQTETERLRRLIDNLLNISRIEAGLMNIDRETVDFKPLIERAVTTMSPHAGEKRIEIRREIAPVGLCAVGDEDMLFQVIVNLLSNAIKYTPEGGRITITADSDNLTHAIHLSVSDTGLGLSKSDADRVFEKFYRVENYRRFAEGTGLGLNLCQQIVETLHSGQMGVESTVGMGSRFWFSVPMFNVEHMRVAA
jgi:signal transduction histidine kinase